MSEQGEKEMLCSQINTFSFLKAKKVNEGVTASKRHHKQTFF